MSSSASNWQVKKAVAVIKHELGVDPDDSDCLHELRDCMKESRRGGVGWRYCW